MIMFFISYLSLKCVILMKGNLLITENLWIQLLFLNNEQFD